MNIMELGAIGELVGGVAVIGSLLYVGFQIRAAHQTFHLSSFGHVKDQFNAVNMTIAAHPELGELFTNGAASFDDLGAAEQLRFGFIGFAYFNILERLYMEHRARIGSGAWEVETTLITALLALPGVAQWWRQNTVSFGPEFRSHIDQLLDAQERQPAEGA